jgi:hypothetical protein
LFEHAVAHARRVLGDDHPTTKILADKLRRATGGGSPAL